MSPLFLGGLRWMHVGQAVRQSHLQEEQLKEKKNNNNFNLNSKLNNVGSKPMVALSHKNKAKIEHQEYFLLYLVMKKVTMQDVVYLNVVAQLLIY